MRRVIDECDDPQLASTLLRVVRVSSGNVVATPGAMASFRSKLLSGTYYYGPFTTFPTYNPSESHSDAVMRLGGSRFGYDALGRPDDDCPDSTRRLQIVAARPAACAVFFQSVIAAVEKVAYGWQPGDKEQTEQDCLFGQVRTDRVVSLRSIVVCQATNGVLARSNVRPSIHSPHPAGGGVRQEDGNRRPRRLARPPSGAVRLDAGLQLRPADGERRRRHVQVGSLRTCM